MGSRSSVSRIDVRTQIPSRNVLRVESVDVDHRPFSTLPSVGPMEMISSSDQIDVSPLQQIVDEADFSPIVERPIRFSSSGHTSPSGRASAHRHDEVLNRHPLEERWTEKYFSHGDQSDVLTDVKSEMHGCVQTLISEDLTSTETYLNQIYVQSNDILQQRFGEINVKEKELIARLLHEQKLLIERILTRGKDTAGQYEKQYRRLLEDFIKKLEIQMTKNLDQLQDQLHFNRETVRQASDESLQLLINRSQQARAFFQAQLQSSSQTQINLYLQRRKEFQSEKKEEPLGFEQWRKLELEIYATAGVIDEQNGSTNIPQRELFRQQIAQTKPQQNIKRVVYLGNKILQ